MKSYLKFLSRNKLYTAIEAAGLIVSLAFILLAGHYVWKQRQMTRNVPDYQDVYSFYRSSNGNSGIGQSWGFAYQAKESIPEVEKAAMFWRASTPEENTVEITVRDWGCGMEDVEKAMQPLYTTGGEERSGMGFTIMESFTDKLKVRSRPGRGTTVVMLRAVRSRSRRL